MERSRVAIVSTSINDRPAAYSEWATAGDLVIAGDLNSPSELEKYVDELNGVYLRPEMQDAPWSQHIGWQNIQRRNAAIFHAFLNGYPYILTVDDDNHAAQSATHFVEGHITSMNHYVSSTIGSHTGFLNTGIFCSPQFHQRGVPYGVVANAVVRRNDAYPQIVVSQAQVLGDPDCDAVERIANAPEVLAVNTNVVVHPGTYAAFNSQGTLWRRDWAPVMAVLPGIGRYDDIFAAYIFARLARTYNVALHVGEPCVTQVRNPHDLAKDLRAELWGMQNVFSFCAALDRAFIDPGMPLWMAYSELIAATSDILPASTVLFAQEWVRSWYEVVA